MLARVLTPELIDATTKQYALLHSIAPPADVAIASDERYGPHERQRLDVFRPRLGARRPVLLFVHGGGFDGGDKALPGTPFYGNVGIWTARNGMLGVVMTYRLAPGHPWPAGAEDVGAAVRWVHANAERYGADPTRIFAMGHSAGAAHLADYIAQRSLHGADGPGIAGAILVSGVYDTRTLPGGPNRAYYGEDPALWAERSALPGLCDASLPLLVAVAEYDPPKFESQALELLAALHKARAQSPRFVRLPGHNHISIVLHIGTAENTLGAEILEFVEQCKSRLGRRRS
jgi:acetyl esterase/lipase